MREYVRPISSETRPESVEPFLSVDALTAGYGPSPVIKGISLVVYPGEIVCVLGPNGAGKSTLLKAITGSLSPSGGRMTLNQEDVFGLRSEELARKGMGYVPQTRDVFDSMSVAENLEMGGYLLSKTELKKRTEEVLEALSRLRPLQRRTASTLSGGERKLLAIARALMLEPTLLVLDEPTANLSTEATKNVLEEHVRSLADSGTAVLLVEQKVKQALVISDRTYVLVGGVVALEGPSVKLLARDDLGEIFLGGSPTLRELETPES